ncbi:MAG: hypothetical protein LUG19_01245, partial [Desulfovibrio sp.]|nr:hypothetical protein [Desulfovibrio sp.]
IAFGFQRFHTKIHGWKGTPEESVNADGGLVRIAFEPLYFFNGSFSRKGRRRSGVGASHR